MFRGGPSGMIPGPGGSPMLLRQTAVNRAQLANTFGLASQPGNLLLYMMTQRQAAAHPPTDGETWTPIQTGQFQRTTTTDENGIGAYACICTIAQAAHATASLTNSVMYEISGSSGLAGITSLLISDQAAAFALDVGPLGALGLGRLAFLLAGEGADGLGMFVAPGVWTVDWFADRDLASVSNTIGGGGAFPQSWYGHTVGAGAAVEARVDISGNGTQKWGGIAVALS